MPILVEAGGPVLGVFGETGYPGPGSMGADRYN